MSVVDTTAIVHAISTPLAASLLSTHPNDATLHSQVLPSEWLSWWAWASDDAPGPPAWLQLLHYFMRPCGDVDAPHRCQIPPELCSLVDAVRSLQRDRTPSAFDTHDAGHGSYRISPKKAHEVDRMSSYIRRIVHSDEPRSVWHAVDVGSGQGYLSRALQESDFDVLALDSNENQTLGANRWATKEAARKLRREYRMHHEGVSATRIVSSHHSAESTNQAGSHSDRAKRGSITHQTVHVCPQSLEEAITGWLIDHSDIQGHGDNMDDRHEPVPVTLVALHACGSLTIDVIRTFLTHRARSSTKHAERAWVPHTLVVVGCCYNLMSHSDFPLSKPLQDLDPIPRLTIAAVHLAAQVPSQWLNNDDTMRCAALALRKVIYRALLHPILKAAVTQFNTIPDRASPSGPPIQPGVGETLENRRLGKLNDEAYRDWPTFLERATGKLGIDLTAINASFPDWLVHETARLQMERALFVVQTLRCILGPLIETLILLDRRDWIKQELAEMTDCGREVEVEMVNLFDQSTGSGRNVALVVRPTTKSEQSLN